MNKPILVTGCAGFIGFHICKKLLENGFNVIGIDNINNYYDINLKNKRLAILSKLHLKNQTWNFYKTDLINKDKLFEIFKEYNPETVINLAAQAGVRYSLENPSAYINSNIVGFSNILECCRSSKVKRLLYASSSSVYGGNTKIPFSENDPVNHPVSLYAATKRSNELMAHTYSHLYKLSCIGLRLFTVYGPWGRPDMAPMIFADAIINKKPIKVFNHGNMSRSFTFIDDVIQNIFDLMQKPAVIDQNFNCKYPNPSTSFAPNMILNIGNSESINLEKFISYLETEFGINAIKEYEETQKGDVNDTQADDSLLKNWIGDSPKTPLSIGIKSFADWYKNYYF